MASEADERYGELWDDALQETLSPTRRAVALRERLVSSQSLRTPQTPKQEPRGSPRKEHGQSMQSGPSPSDRAETPSTRASFAERNANYLNYTPVHSRDRNGSTSSYGAAPEMPGTPASMRKVGGLEFFHLDGIPTPTRSLTLNWAALWTPHGERRRRSKSVPMSPFGRRPCQAGSSERDRTPDDNAPDDSPPRSEIAKGRLTLCEMLHEIQREARLWNMDEDDLKACLQVAKQLLHLLTDVKEMVGSGALIVHAPSSILARMMTEPTDDGYMRRRTASDNSCHVLDHHEEFAEVFHEFMEKSKDDRWPTNYRDRDARGKAKDGGWSISARGFVRDAGVKFLTNQTQVENSWKDHGMRHFSGLCVATTVEHGIVYVRSDNGSVHVITSHGARTATVFELIQPGTVA